ncbi:Leucine-rich repeat-containing protein [Artemisia annua]|uniref:Leucine-rich repeat-containing protein n=1 Tax=Artemisia annua TaxID=35608 RepID=A0A2U1N2Z9_ARTAN|nr:Leucine-rich repeat-containing protein [Artemisia annua]
MASTPMLKLMLSLLLILKSIIIPSFSCPVHQKHALLHFKSSLTATYNSKYSVKFKSLDSWNSTSDCCSWKLVNCSGTGSVTELHLSEVTMIISSDIPSEILTPIFRIRSLELLDISRNLLEGKIPGDGFSNLTKLLHLDMQYNYFNGSIPSQLFQLTNLRYLDMSNNNLEGKLGPELGSFRKLTTLWLSNNGFQGPIPAQLFELESLRDLDLSRNNLGGSLSPEIGKLRNLESLSLDNNFLWGNIPEEIGNLTKLRYFSLYNNSFSGGIPSSIANLTKLDKLDLSQNSLSFEIPTSIGRLTKLTYLGLRSNQLTGPIPSSIGRLTNLTSLDLSSNQFTGPIPSSMQNMSKLEYLRLDDNMLAGEIPTWLFKVRTLKEIYIGGKGSKLIWNNTSQIPEWISSQKELGVLDLSGNKLEGRFPHWLAEMNNISSIILSDNNLSGSIPPRLFISDYLWSLDLSRNNFSGELPESIGNAKSIGYLAVSENHFSGLIPKSISNLKRIFVLDLSRNRFSGDSLPIFRAEYLDLSDNDFSGKIPTNFSKDTEILYLGGNKFSGSLPFNLTKLVKLRVLDLHNSIITGNLQDILPQFPTSLEILILRNTSLNGYIPTNISKCTSLRILDLSGNNLTGSIPQQIANLPRMIRTLNMSASSYSEYGDRIEDLIVNWKNSSRRLGNSPFFVLLDLSDNNISGEIPTSLGNLKALKQLNISHNRISGHIPLSLGNLESIESLDVSHNEISGSIPQSLVQLHELGTLDVSNNMLTGKIPSGGQMDTMNELGFQNNSGLCGIPINIKCSEDIPSSEGRVKEEEDLSRMFWEGTWIGFPIGFFSTFLIMSYLLNFIQLFKICNNCLLNTLKVDQKVFVGHPNQIWPVSYHTETVTSFKSDLFDPLPNWPILVDVHDCIAFKNPLSDAPCILSVICFASTQVEYTDHSGHPHIAFAEAPNEALLPDCRPTFNGAWLAKDKFKGLVLYRPMYCTPIYSRPLVLWRTNTKIGHMELHKDFFCWKGRPAANGSPYVGFSLII